MCFPQKQIGIDSMLHPIDDKDGPIDIDEQEKYILPSSLPQHTEKPEINTLFNQGFLGYFFETGKSFIVVFVNVLAGMLCTQNPSLLA